MFRSESPVTTVFSAITLILAALIYTKRIDAFDVYFNRDKIFKEGEYWRVLTSLFLFGPDLITLLSIVTMIFHSARVEEDVFARRPVDFLIFWGCGAAGLLAWACFHSVFFLGEGITSYLLYYDVKTSPDRLMMIWPLPLQFRAGWMPVVMTVVSYFVNGMRFPVVHFVGYAIAQMFFFLKDVLNLRFERSWFCAPERVNQFVRDILP